MRYDRDGYAVEKAIRLSQPLPDWYLEEPDVLPVDQFYLQAFWRLVTERRGGPCIPYSKIVEYGERSGLNPITIEVFTTVVWSLDGEYSKWQSGEQQRREFSKKPSPSKRAKKGIGSYGRG